MSVPYARIHFLAAPHHQGPARNEKVQWISGGKSSDELRHIRYRVYPVSFVSISFRRVPRIKLARSKRSIFFSERLSLSAECLLFRSARERRKKARGAPPRLSQAAFRRSFTRHGDSGSAINGAKKAHRQRKTKYMREITPPRSSTLSLRDTREQKKEKKWGKRKRRSSSKGGILASQ